MVAGSKKVFLVKKTIDLDVSIHSSQRANSGLSANNKTSFGKPLAQIHSRQPSKPDVMNKSTMSN